jgi:hypothetical protein
MAVDRRTLVVRLLLWVKDADLDVSCYTGILSQGLRIAPPEAPVTGYMFGKGVYFADVGRSTSLTLSCI